MKIHHATLKAITTAGCKIEEFDSRPGEFVLTNEELGLRTTGDDARELRELAQQWAVGENIEDYGVEGVIEDDGEESLGAVIVSEKYRKRYSEAGHPGNNGDWLAGILENLTHAADGSFDMTAFVAIVEANGIVDWQKYVKGNPRTDAGQVRLNCGNRLRAIIKRTRVLKTPETNYSLPDDFLPYAAEGE